jgi:hypothetical protein
MLPSTFSVSGHNFMWRDPTQWNVKKALAADHSLNLCAQQTGMRINHSDSAQDGNCMRTV